MSDANRELTDLRREIVEARNQAIKTDNQVKNIGLDVKGFEKRFDALERRTRIASLGAHLLVAIVIAIAASIVSNIRVGAYGEQLQDLQQTLAEVRQQADTERQALDQRLKASEERGSRHQQAERTMLAVLDHLEAKRDREATDLLPDLAVSDLSSLEQRLLKPRLSELRTQGAEAAFEKGRQLLTGERPDAAVQALARAVQLDPEGPLALKAAYLQATTLASNKRYDQLEPVVRMLRAQTKDPAVAEEANYLLGVSLARLGKRNEAKSVLAQSTTRGAYQASARAFLEALEAGTELPANP